MAMVGHVEVTLRDQRHEAVLDRYGFAVVPFLDDETRERLSRVHDELGSAPDDPRRALNFAFHSQSIHYKRAMEALIRPIVASSCEATFVDHVPYLSTFITKWPGPDSGFGPHQDPTLVDERRFRGVSIWTPLEATGVANGLDNGMLHVVPGSHRFAEGPRVRNVNESVFAEYSDIVVDRWGVGVPTRPGEAIVFDNRIIHYSMPNETSTPRVVVSLGMRPAASACVLPRGSDDGMVELFEVDDETWIEVLASAVPMWDPPSPPIAKLAPPSGPSSVVQFEGWCAAVGSAPGTVPGRRSKLGLEPRAFCSFCGSIDGLGEESRNGRGNAQLLCAACSARVAASRLPGITGARRPGRAR